MGQEVYLPLFETKAAKGRVAYKLYSLSVFVGIFSIWVFRAGHLPPAETERGRRWGWIGLSMAELWFSFYWFLTQFARWNPVYRSTFKHRLSQSYRYEKELPGVDVFVCTADPTIEPPIMVVNTVLSVMAYDYPPERLAVYLSDDAGSELTFYALLEASRFAKHWLPFCKKFKVEPRSPAAYFTTVDRDDQELLGDGGEYRSSVKKIYEEMRDRIDIATRLARIPSDIRNEHKGFCEWDLVSSARNHPAILQILIDGRETKVVGIENHDKLPTLVYLSREKRPHRHHNFKAGAMNALIRVSSKMSNGPIILNVDCDVYSNNSESVRDAMCFFMDENKGHEVAYVQYPQSYNNLTRNDLHGICFRVLNEVDLAAMDANGGPCYIGSGCFHRRESLCGMKYDRKECGGLDQWRKETDKNEKQSAIVLEDMSKVLANCTYEDNTQWGREITSLWILPFAYVLIAKYGCSLAEFITCGGTPLGWWNEQRIWVFRRTTSFCFAFLETIARQLGFTKLEFVVTAKVSDSEVYQRYLQETMEFGSPSPMFTVLSTIAMINLLSFVWGLKRMIMDAKYGVLEQLGLQIVLCGVIVLINLPVYKGLFFRRDKGKMPSSVMYKSVMLAFLACSIALYLV
ncbi:cellulose synthase-like protein E1 isoform X3 [Rhododendron vialii]|uniref:cellulose synthase-like protein E1 isoform X3 n=1 Tax=Rhododendron vialii TaxID=182163 RepID=UPI00265F9EC5|nr:cellulose synthase-like protein E1 isoform X3 [Rhododendron vialii]